MGGTELQLPLRLEDIHSWRTSLLLSLSLLLSPSLSPSLLSPGSGLKSPTWRVAKVSNKPRPHQRDISISCGEPFLSTFCRFADSTARLTWHALQQLRSRAENKIRGQWAVVARAAN